MVLGRPRIVRRLLSDGLRVIPLPEVKVRTFTHILPDGVETTLTVRFVWDDHVGIVHLDADTAWDLAAQLMFTASGMKPELVG